MTVDSLDDELEDALTALMSTSILVPGEAYNNTNAQTGTVFTSYATSVLFPLALPNGTSANESNDTVDSNVIGAAVAEQKIAGLTNTVNITFQSIRALQAMVSL